MIVGGQLLLVDTQVIIRARDDFYAFVDGWPGKVHGYTPEGYVDVRCERPDGVKTLFVPEDQLEVVKA